MRLAELFVEITGRDGGLNRTLANVRRNLMGFASSASQIHVPLGGLLVGLAGAGYATAAAVRQAADLEKAYSQVRKTTGLTGAELDALKTKLVTLSTTMAGVSLEEINGIAAMAGRLGIQGVDGIASFTKSIAMIRVALDDIPAEEAATRISRILNVFKLGPGDALSFASALNKLDDTSTATGREILELTSDLSGVAAALGMTPQKVLALSSVLKDAGVGTAIAGTAFSHIMMKMATDTREFAKVSGVSTREFAAALKGDPLEAIKLFMRGIAGMESGERMKALEYLELQGHMTGASVLQLAQVMGKVDGAVSTANSEWKSHASILKEVEIQGQNTWDQLTLLGNNFKVVAGSLGSLLLPALKQAAAGLGEVATDVRENFGGLRESVTPALDAIRSGIETAMVVYRNFGDVVSLVGIDIAEGLDYVAAMIEHVGATTFGVFAYIAGNVSKIGAAFYDAFTNPIARITESLKGLAAIMGKLAIGQVPGAEDFAAAVPKAFQNAIEGLRLDNLILPEFKFDSSGFDAARREINDRIAGSERARLESKAKAAAEGAVGGGQAKADDGTGKAPGKERKVFAGGLEEFAKHLQAGIFEKDDANKQTAENTGKVVGLLERANDLAAKAAAKGGGPGYATGPA